MSKEIIFGRRGISPLLLVAVIVIALSNMDLHAHTTTHYERGRELFEAGRYIDARVELREAVRYEGKSESIDYMLAKSAMELGIEDAFTRFVAFEIEYPITLFANEVSYMQGVIKSDEGEIEQAIVSMRSVDVRRLDAKQREEYSFRMGHLLFRLGDNEGAVEYLKQVEQSSDFYHHALYFIAYISYESGNFEQAKREFEELLPLSDMYRPLLPYYLLEIEFKMNNYSRALNYGVDLLEHTSPEQREELMRIIAESFFRLDRYAEALDYIDRYLAIGGELGRDESYIKGFSLHQVGRYSEAIEYLKRACGADDALTQNASFHLANCYLHTGDKAGAMRAFSMASNDTFNAAIAEESLFNQAKLQYELGGGHFNETINLLTRYSSKYRDAKRLAEVQTLLAAAYYNSRDYATAYDNIMKVRNPDAEIQAAKQKITYLRGLEQFVGQNHAEAERYLKESITIGVTPKQSALASYWLGEIAFRRGDYSAAIDGYNRFVARSVKGSKAAVEAQYSIAYALMMQGNEERAIEYFRAYANDKESSKGLRADAYNRMGDIYYGLRRFSQATTAYRQAIAEGVVESNYSRYQMAIILGLEGDTNGKISTLKSITEPAAGEDMLDDALYELGRTYINREEYQTAITTLESLLRKYPKSSLYAQTLSDLGVASINANDSKGALEYYDRAIKSAPQSQVAKDAMQGVREIYVSQGEASKYFKYAESVGMEGDISVVARDSLSFASARGLYFSSEGEASRQRVAAKALSSYIKDYPKGYYLSDALFYLGDSYIKMGERRSAISTLTTLEARGGSQYSQSVNRMLAKLTFDEGLFVQSMETSRKLFDLVKESSLREEAMGLYLRATFATKDSAVMVKASDDVLALGEELTGAVATSHALYIRATNLRERGERADAMKIYTLLMQRDSAKDYQSEARYHLIDDAYRAGDYTLAEKMVFEFSDSASADAYWLAMSFILLGDIYLANGDSFQARATLQSIVDGYSSQDDGVVEMARQRIEKL